MRRYACASGVPQLGVDVAAFGVHGLYYCFPAGCLFGEPEARHTGHTIAFEVRGKTFGYEEAAGGGALDVVFCYESIGAPDSIWVLWRCVWVEWYASIASSRCKDDAVGEG